MDIVLKIMIAHKLTREAEKQLRKHPVCYHGHYDEGPCFSVAFGVGVPLSGDDPVFLLNGDRTVTLKKEGKTEGVDHDKAKLLLCRALGIKG